MRILILGGSKSGKSDFAQEIALKLAEGGAHYYVATLANSGSEEDRATRGIAGIACVAGVSAGGEGDSVGGGHCQLFAG